MKRETAINFRTGIINFEQLNDRISILSLFGRGEAMNSVKKNIKMRFKSYVLIFKLYIPIHSFVEQI